MEDMELFALDGDDPAFFTYEDWARNAMKTIRKIMKDPRLDDTQRFERIYEVVMRFTPF